MSQRVELIQTNWIVYVFEAVHAVIAVCLHLNVTPLGAVSVMLGVVVSVVKSSCANCAVVKSVGAVGVTVMVCELDNTVDNTVVVFTPKLIVPLIAELVINMQGVYSFANPLASLPNILFAVPVCPEFSQANSIN